MKNLLEKNYRLFAAKSKFKDSQIKKSGWYPFNDIIIRRVKETEIVYICKKLSAKKIKI